MKLKILTLFVLSLLLPYLGQASSKVPSQIAQTEIHATNTRQYNESSRTLASVQRSGHTNTQVSFATRTGFVLLRKEEIISLSVNKLYGGLMLQYWRRGVVKNIQCQSTIKDAMKLLSDFPFVKVSRSAIVNMDEVAEYVGNRRNAHLVLRSESVLKISRNKAKEIYDWFERGASQFVSEV